MEPAREENDTMPLPVTPASEPAPKKLCTPGEVSSSGQETEKMSGKSKTSGNNSAVGPGVGDAIQDKPGSRLGVGAPSAPDRHENRTSKATG